MYKILILIAATLALSSCACPGNKTKREPEPKMMTGAYGPQRTPTAEWSSSAV